MPLVENGCIVGTWLKSGGDSAPSWPAMKPTLECAMPIVWPSSWTSVAGRSKSWRWPLMIRNMSSISAWPPLTISWRGPKPLTAAGANPSAVIARPVSSTTTSCLPSPERSPHWGFALVPSARFVSSKSTADLVTVPNGSCAVGTAFHVLIAVAISVVTSVGPPSTVRLIGSAAQWSGCTPDTAACCDRCW